MNYAGKKLVMFSMFNYNYVVSWYASKMLITKTNYQNFVSWQGIMRAQPQNHTHCKSVVCPRDITHSWPQFRGAWRSPGLIGLMTKLRIGKRYRRKSHLVDVWQITFFSFSKEFYCTDIPVLFVVRRWWPWFEYMSFYCIRKIWEPSITGFRKFCDTARGMGSG